MLNLHKYGKRGIHGIRMSRKEDCKQSIEDSEGEKEERIKPELTDILAMIVAFFLSFIPVIVGFFMFIIVLLALVYWFH